MTMPMTTMHAMASITMRLPLTMMMLSMAAVKYLATNKYINVRHEQTLYDEFLQYETIQKSGNIVCNLKILNINGPIDDDLKDW